MNNLVNIVATKKIIAIPRGIIIVYNCQNCKIQLRFENNVSNKKIDDNVFNKKLKNNICMCCHKYYCSDCLKTTNKYSKKNVCVKCMPRCHIDGCENQSIIYCLLCEYPICIQHKRYGNRMPDYCADKMSDDCVESAKTKLAKINLNLARFALIVATKKIDD